MINGKKGTDVSQNLANLRFMQQSLSCCQGAKMNKRTITNCVIILLTHCFFSLIATELSAGEKSKISLENSGKYSVSLKARNFSEKERMVGFIVKLVSGKIDSLKSAPIGWNINIDNDPSWRTKFIGTCIVGATALSPDEFNNMLIIEKDEFFGEKEEEGVKGPNFDISVEITVTEDFDKTRTLTYKMKDLIFQKITKP